MCAGGQQQEGARGSAEGPEEEWEGRPRGSEVAVTSRPLTVSTAGSPWGARAGSDMMPFVP